MTKKQGTKAVKVAGLQKQNTLLAEKQLYNFRTACVQYALYGAFMRVLVQAKETDLSAETGTFQSCEWMFWS